MAAAVAAISFETSVYGQGRSITVAGTSLRNATALSPGKYLFRVTGAPINVRSGGSGVSAATTDMYIENGDAFYVVVPDNNTNAFLAMIRSGSTSATVYVCGADEQTAASQPPSWS